MKNSPGEPGDEGAAPSLGASMRADGSWRRPRRVPRHQVHAPRPPAATGHRSSRAARALRPAYGSRAEVGTAS
ncbi:MAG: hypothetical protein EOO99_12165 [Pedobacter sp.]|nr:MAG: hypothetical protein EOO99_12165 [Pedobacter sp.]